MLGCVAWRRERVSFFALVPLVCRRNTVYLAVYFDGLASVGQIKIHGVQADADPLLTFELNLQTSQEVDHQPLWPGRIGELPGLPSFKERVHAVSLDCDLCALRPVARTRLTGDPAASVLLIFAGEMLRRAPLLFLSS